jgi:probable F420-dependent oxidoreductase
VTLPRVSVVLGLWPDRPPEENLAVARRAAELGYPELWIGEMATYDAPALAATVAQVAPPIAMTIGPLAVHVRTPVTIAMATASLAALGGQPVGVALGTSSSVVVEHWHGRSRARPAANLAESSAAVRRLLAGEKVNGFRLRLPPPDGCTLTVAALGPGAIRVAAEQADRMVANLVTTEMIADLRAGLERAAATADRPRPGLAVWVVAAVEPRPEAWEQIRYALVAYLAAPGYRDMFRRAGMGEAVTAARSGTHPRELLSLIPDELVSSVGLIGDEATVRRRLVEYAEAGADEVCLVPVTAGDDGAERTLARLAPGVLS